MNPDPQAMHHPAPPASRESCRVAPRTRSTGRHPRWRHEPGNADPSSSRTPPAARPPVPRRGPAPPTTPGDRGGGGVIRSVSVVGYTSTGRAVQAGIDRQTDEPHHAFWRRRQFNSCPGSVPRLSNPPTASSSSAGSPGTVSVGPGPAEAGRRHLRPAGIIIHRPLEWDVPRNLAAADPPPGLLERDCPGHVTGRAPVGIAADDDVPEPASPVRAAGWFPLPTTFTWVGDPSRTAAGSAAATTTSSTIPGPVPWTAPAIVPALRQTQTLGHSSQYDARRSPSHDTAPTVSLTPLPYPIRCSFSRLPGPPAPSPIGDIVIPASHGWRPAILVGLARAGGT